MLRRTKEAVDAELPPKQEQVIEVVLQPRHQRIYQTHLQRERQKVLGLIEDLDGNRFTILRVADAAAPAEPRPGAGRRSARRCRGQQDRGPARRCSTSSSARATRRWSSASSPGSWSRVAARLAAAGVEHAYLDGRTRNRAQVIERFRDGEAPVFLISLKAGGFGLNLTEADYCFVLDPWWNPAAEAQAVDRAHRIGQQTGHGLPARRPGHHRGEGDGPQGPQAALCSTPCWATTLLGRPVSEPTRSASCWAWMKSQ